MSINPNDTKERPLRLVAEALIAAPELLDTVSRIVRYVSAKGHA